MIGKEPKMKMWIAALRLEPREFALFEALANQVKGWRQIGGRVTVTNLRLVFTPNRLDKLFGAHDVSVPRLDIVKVQIAPAGYKRGRGLSASFRPQVEVTVGDSAMLVFTVSDPISMITVLND